MKTLSFTIFLTLLLLLPLPGPASGQYQDAWEEMTAAAGADWLGRRSHSSLALPDGSIVLMGGRLSVPPLRRNDVWRSTDQGATWDEISPHEDPPPPIGKWLGREGHTSVVLSDESIVLMGGWNGVTRYNDVWRSTNKGAMWGERPVDGPRWTARHSHTSVVLPDGSIVLMGGEDSGGRKNDVWRSTDKGASWTEMTANAEWLARNGHASVVLPDGSIVLMGGWANAGRQNDVWRSTNKGATWTRMTANAEWSVRSYLTSVALPDGSIVFMGGNDGSQQNDMWRSTDQGASWTEMTATVGWSARSSPSSVVLPDGSIVLMGGIDLNFDMKNDVWRALLYPWTVTLPTATSLGDATLSAVTAGHVFTSVTAQMPPGGGPDNVSFPYGFFRIIVSGLAADGDCSEVRLQLPKNTAINTYYKYGRTQANPADHWYEFMYDGDTGAIINHTATQTEITLHLCDGLRGDSDLTANRVIDDPGGPGVPIAGPAPTHSIPTMNQWGLMIMSVLFVLTALIMRRRGVI